MWVGHQVCTGLIHPFEQGSAESLRLLLDQLRRVGEEIAEQQRVSRADLHLPRVDPPLFDLADLGLNPVSAKWQMAPPRRSGLRARWDEWRARRDIEAGRREVEKEQRAIQRERDFQEQRKKRLGLQNQESIDWGRYWGPD